MNVSDHVPLSPFHYPPADDITGSWGRLRQSSNRHVGPTFGETPMNETPVSVK
jgi:hypothetical protein